MLETVICRADSLPAGLPWADLHPLAPSPLHPHQSDPGPTQHSPPFRDPGEEVGSVPSSLHGDEESQAAPESCAESETDHWLRHIPAPLLVAWDAVGCALSFAETPLWAFRRASIPLLEAECYSRPWYVLIGRVHRPVWWHAFLKAAMTSICWHCASLWLGCGCFVRSIHGIPSRCSSRVGISTVQIALESS